MKQNKCLLILLVEELGGTKCIIGRLKSNADGRQVQDKHKEVLLHMVNLF